MAGLCSSLISEFCFSFANNLIGFMLGVIICHILDGSFPSLSFEFSRWVSPDRFLNLGFT
ncbi:hypothetical protein ISN44_As04g026420 [Arabidopsis suecica]|uniref:Transmembrane protein n=2 Tax=Arabidopsis TaxID=3701 RepID=Q0WQ74_ARATH|nr:uncharacterized protein AT4G34881 [Arabidopsis thaliana]AEE86433.1 transmembrane protein [Arabidopsis thaliana]KAG7621783.1 hypothetical protein ISN44_As04g026420 [Arabidopsis suecica]BAF00725.1 hypothetical protein [Arabidopsis thaliana]|eukprot:NP_001119117.1 transmembrane protein [Arabidopsis thaliana]